ncbi:hypothetical protein LZ30DRAFT_689135 [Colletotrichum cereale]|nr:hypothetical protein LZ30DRAFT_689135 [Colletotrichum cereale]
MPLDPQHLVAIGSGDRSEKTEAYPDLCKLQGGRGLITAKLNTDEAVFPDVQGQAHLVSKRSSKPLAHLGLRHRAVYPRDRTPTCLRLETTSRPSCDWMHKKFSADGVDQSGLVHTP